MESPSPLDNLDKAIFITLPQESHKDFSEPYTNITTTKE